jgi:DnaJ-class molecular chaperone
MQYKDYYAILGVAPDASLEHIKKAYRLLAKTHHPDMSKEVGAEERFKEAAEAYACLKNPEKRAAYDQFGFAGVVAVVVADVVAGATGVVVAGVVAVLLGLLAFAVCVNPVSVF